MADRDYAELMNKIGRLVPLREQYFASDDAFQRVKKACGFPPELDPLLRRSVLNQLSELTRDAVRKLSELTGEEADRGLLLGAYEMEEAAADHDEARDALFRRFPAILRTTAARHFEITELLEEAWTGTVAQLFDAFPPALAKERERFISFMCDDDLVDDLITHCRSLDDLDRHMRKSKRDQMN